MLTFVGEKRVVQSLAFTPDGSTLAVGGGDPDIALWEIASGTVVARVNVILGHYPDAIRFDPSGQWLLVAAERRPLTAHEVRGPKAIPLSEFKSAYPFALSPDGKQLVHAHGNNHFRSIRMPEAADAPVWEVVLNYDRHAARVAAQLGVGFLADGTRLATVHRTWHQTRIETVERWRVEEQPSQARFVIREAAAGFSHVCAADLPTTNPDGLAVSPRAEQAVVRAGFTLIVCTVVWRKFDDRDVPTLQVQEVPNTDRKQFAGAAFHPTAPFLATTCGDESVTFYDTTTWTVAKTYTWHIGRLRSVAFSPDGLLAAAGSDNGKIVVWDVDV